MNATEERMINRYYMGKITLKQLLDWHDDYIKEMIAHNNKIEQDKAA